MIDKEKVLTGLECCSMNGNGCKRCPYNKDCDEMPDYGNAQLCSDALELLKEQRETIASLQGTICKLNAALAEQPEQKHGHWKGFTQSRYFGTDDDGEPIFRDGVFYVCSECRRKSIIKYPYCPRCGAKMDEEVKHE